MGRHIAVLDIGSSKIICLIAAINGDKLAVHGVGVCEYTGYRAGDYSSAELPNKKDIATAMRRALSQVGHEARLNIKSVVLGVGAPFLKTVLMRGEIFSRNKPRVCIEGDEDRLMDISLKDTDFSDFERLHSTPVRFFADDIEFPALPVNTEAFRLVGEMSHVYAQSEFAEMIFSSLHELGVSVDTSIGVPLAEAMMLIPQRHREMGCLLVDIGYAHTDVSFVKNMAIMNTAVIGVGGKHITSDLSYGLELPSNTAEGIKRRFVFGLDYKNSVDSIRMSDGTIVYVEEDFVRSIIESRVEEIGDLIMEYSSKVGFVPDSENPVPLYLTGGGLSLMRGSGDFLEKYLGITICMDMPQMPRFSSPNYVSAFAVADFALSMGVNTVFAQESRKKGGLFSRKFRK